jgi:hypothetical protein
VRPPIRPVQRGHDKQDLTLSLSLRNAAMMTPSGPADEEYVERELSPSIRGWLSLCRQAPNSIMPVKLRRLRSTLPEVTVNCSPQRRTAPVRENPETVVHARTVNGSVRLAARARHHEQDGPGGGSNVQYCHTCSVGTAVFLLAARVRDHRRCCF